MPSESSVDVVLTWSRDESGTTAVLVALGDGRYDELGRTDATEFTVLALAPGRAYDFAAAPVEADGDLAPQEEWESLRVVPLADDATPARPAAPTGFAAAQDGPNVNLRWDAATDGLTVAHELRVGDSWEDGALVAADGTGTSYSWPWSTSGARTFHVKAVDRFGRASTDAASVALTIEPLDDHVTSDTSDQAATGWPGTATHMEEDAGALRHERVVVWSEMTMPWSSLADLPWSAKYWPVGVYETPAFDVGQVEKQRIEVDLGAAQPIDEPAWSDLDLPTLGTRSGDNYTSQNTWQAAPLRPVDAVVEIDTCPTPDGPWDGWRPYAPGTYSFRRCRMRVTVRGDGMRFVRVPRLVLTRRKFNRKQEGHVVVNCSPVEVVFPVPFQNPPKVTATVLGYAGTPLVTNITPNGFTIAGGAAVFVGDPATFAPTIHWQAMGT